MTPPLSGEACLLKRFVGTRRAVSAGLCQGASRWKRSTGTFPKARNSKRDTGRSEQDRSALEKLSLFSPTCSVRQEHGAESFAVCGQRLRGHVPSKNSSPTALSWISLMGQQLQNRSVSARWFLIFAVRIFPYRVSIPRINPAFCATINACPKQTRILN